MSDNKKSNDSIDLFSNYIRDRLVNKPTLPDAECWDEIEQRLQKKKTMMSPVWLGLTVAASVIVAVFIFFNSITEKENHEQQNLFVLKENEVEKNDVLEEEDKVVTKSDYEKVAVTSAKNNIKAKSLTESDVTKSDDSPEIVPPENDVAVISPAEEPDSNKNENSIDSSIKTVDFADISLSQKGSGNRWLILSGIVPAGGVGYLLSSSSSLFVAENHHSFDSSPEGISPPLDDDVDYHGENPGEVIADINYFIPITYGMTARKRINNTLGIETGIVYTFLKTDYKINNAPVTQKLHYIGVPVKLIVNVWEKKSWGVYVSGGGMVEKGLQSVYQKKGEPEKVKQSISGLQWSLSSGVGLSYRIYKDLNLYLEPCFSYYFDTNQPLSIRTEDPFNFNLRMGLRYDF